MSQTVIRLRRYALLASLAHNHDDAMLLYCWWSTLNDDLYLNAYANLQKEC